MCCLVVLVAGPGSSWASQPTNSSSLTPPGGLSSAAQTNSPDVADSKESSCSSMLGSSLPVLTPLEQTLLFCTGEVQGLLSLYLVRGRTRFSVLKLRGMLSCLSKVARREGDSIFPLPLPCHAYQRALLLSVHRPSSTVPSSNRLSSRVLLRRGVVSALGYAAAGEGQGQVSYFLSPVLSPARFQRMRGARETFPYPCHHLADGSLINPPALTGLHFPVSPLTGTAQRHRSPQDLFIASQILPQPLWPPFLRSVVG